MDNYDELKMVVEEANIKPCIDPKRPDSGAGIEFKFANGEGSMLILAKPWVTSKIIGTKGDVDKLIGTPIETIHIQPDCQTAMIGHEQVVAGVNRILLNGGKDNQFMITLSVTGAFNLYNETGLMIDIVFSIKGQGNEQH